ncbi:MAG: two-component sensor histidine kinase, partial [Anaerolineales bacterium]
MQRLKTLRVRFALWTALLLLAVLATFGVYVYGSLASGLSAAIDEALALSASQVGAALDLETGQFAVPDSFAEEPEIVSLLARGYS